jgi:PAS domain S-box-containing protein
VYAARFRALAAATGQITWTADPSGRDGDVSGWCAFTGQDPIEAARGKWFAAIHPEDRARAFRAFRAAWEARRAYEVEYRLRRADGVYRWFVMRGVPILDEQQAIVEWVGCCTDITELREARDVALEQATRLNTIFETITDGIILYGLDGHIIEANSAFHTLFGITDPETYYRLPYPERFTLIEARDANGIRLDDANIPIARILRGERLIGTDAVNELYRTLDGREIVTSVIGAPLYDDEGAIMGGVVLCRDITERRELERQRQQMPRTVAHELNQPLTSLKVQAQSATRQLQQGANPSLAMMERMGASIGQMERLVRDLLDTAWLETGNVSLNMERVDLAALCAQAAEDKATTGREVKIEAETATAPVIGDGLRITQVLSNLLSNALRYSPVETPVTVRLDVTDGVARVSVRDEGAGIPLEAQAAIFEPFYRVEEAKITSSSGVRLGLGLYISRLLVKRLDGDMGVESTPGHGSTFWFTLPLAEDA